jgi:hypothetical protein
VSEYGSCCWKVVVLVVSMMLMMPEHTNILSTGVGCQGLLCFFLWFLSSVREPRCVV